MLTSLTACSENSADNTDVNKSGDAGTSSTDVETEEEIDEKTLYAPDLPAKDYDGYSFRIVSRNDDMHSYPVHTRDLYAEEYTGDALNDAVFERNASLADKYNVEVVLETYSETANETTPNQKVENSVQADSDDYDLLASHMIYAANSAIKKVFLNFNSLEYCDYSKPYWNPGTIEAFSVGPNMFLALSDMCFSSNDNTHCLVYNKQLATDYQIGDVYELVNNNNWTFDKFRSLVSGVTNDVDGDGKMTENDIYGYLIGGTSGTINWMFAGDCHVVAKDADNLPYLDFMNEHLVSVFDWTYELCTSDDVYTIGSWVDRQVPLMFGGDHALFMCTQIGVIEDMREMESDFGVLPYPKYNEEQKNYYHYVDGHATLMAIPKTCRDLERQSIVLEYLAYISYKDVLPIYFDVLMTKRNVRDVESGVMLELIYNTRAFDFAYVYDNFSLSFCFSNLVSNKNSDIASFYAKQEKVTNKLLEKNIKVYTEE